MEIQQPTQKETLGEIATSIAPKQRKRQRKATNSRKTDPVQAELVEILFKTAKKNIDKVNEEKEKERAKLQAVNSKPTLKLENGVVVIDTQAMVEACTVQVKTETFEKINEGNSKMVPKKKRYSERWAPSDTELFYTALQLFGIDFEMISYFLNNRTRESIKRKYKKENKENPVKIAFALDNKISLTDKAYSKYVNYLKNHLISLDK